MGSRSDFVNVVRDEDRRKREEAKIQHVQQQLDESRHMARELLSRLLRLEEQFKASEAAWAQHRLALDQHKHEVAQAGQARQLEEARVRQQLNDLAVRIEDSTRPIRSLQAHVAELVETVRRQREDTGHDTKKYDELRGLIEHLAAHNERQISVAQSLRDSIDAVRHEVERQQREILRTDDAVRIVEQELRRRVAELVQQLENMQLRMQDEFGSVRAVEAQVSELRDFLETIDPQFEGIRETQERFEADVARFHAQAVERDELAAERLEEIRQQFDLQVRDLHEIADQRYERANHRVDELEEVDRSLSYRITMIEMHLDELRQVDERLRREMWYLNEQRARLRLEQAQHELEAITEMRREADQREAPERPGGTT